MLRGNDSQGHDFGFSSPRLDVTSEGQKTKLDLDISKNIHVHPHLNSVPRSYQKELIKHSLCLVSRRSKHTPTLQKIWSIQKCSQHLGFSCSVCNKTKTKKKQTLRRVSKLSVVVHESMDPKRLIKKLPKPWHSFDKNLE